MEDYSDSNYNLGELTVNIMPDILFVKANNREVIKIGPTGDLYWNNRLVETDEDFKASMLDLAEHFKRRWL